MKLEMPVTTVGFVRYFEARVGLVILRIHYGIYLRSFDVLGFIGIKVR